MTPIEYRLELYDTSGRHRPIAVITAASPRRYTVHSVKHVVTQQGDRIVARYCLNLTPFDGERSPVWGAE